MRGFLFVGLFLFANALHTNTGDYYEVFEKFGDWMETHDKWYTSLNEFHHRFDVFRNNFRFVQNQNRLYENGQSSWKATIENVFADLKPQEFSEKYLGYTGQSTKKFQVYSNQLSYPEAVNWVENGSVTDVKDQGQCGSCYIFSAVGAIESSLALKTGKLVSLSEQQVLDCDHLDNHCDGGLMENVFTYVESVGGLDSEKNYQYNACQSSQCQVDLSKLIPETNVTGFVNVVPNNQTEFLSSLSQRPLSIAIDASTLQFYDSGVIDECGTDLDHGVLAVGYNTSAKHPYILVKNSWGSYFGENGYFRLSLQERNANGTCGAYMDVSYPVL